METYLTIKEAAELKGCSTRYLRQAALSGTVKAKKELNDKNRPQYLIPLSALDTKLQLKYQKSHRLELSEQQKTDGTQNKTIEELNEQQRNQVNTWLLIIENWQSYRNQYKGSKAEADKAYIALVSEKYPDIKITYDILQRKYNAIRKGDKVALADGRGYTRKGASSIPATVWDAFLYYYLDERQYPVKKCYEYTRLWTREEQPHLLEQIPSYATFCRHIESLHLSVFREKSTTLSALQKMLIRVQLLHISQAWRVHNAFQKR